MSNAMLFPTRSTISAMVSGLWRPRPRAATAWMSRSRIVKSRQHRGSTLLAMLFPMTGPMLFPMSARRSQSFTVPTNTFVRRMAPHTRAPCRHMCDQPHCRCQALSLLTMLLPMSSPMLFPMSGRPPAAPATLQHQLEMRGRAQRRRTWYPSRRPCATRLTPVVLFTMSRPMLLPMSKALL